MRKRNKKAVLDHRQDKVVLYDLDTDPQELQPILTPRSPVEEDLIGSLHQWIKRTARLRRDLPQEAQQAFTPDANLDRQLEALGYIEVDKVPSPQTNPPHPQD